MHVPGAGRRRVRCSRRATPSTCWSASTRRRSTSITTSWPHDGHMVCDAESVRVTPEFESRSSEVRAGRDRAGGRRRAGAARTWSSVGLVCGLLGIDTARIEEMILKRYAHKGDVGEANIRSLRGGLRASRATQLPEGAHKLRAPRRDGRGARARVRQPGDLPRRAARGARATTPATRSRRRSDILEWLAARLPELRRRRDPDRGRDRRAGVGARRLLRGQEGDDRHVRARACR